MCWGVVRVWATPREGSVDFDGAAQRPLDALEGFGGSRLRLLVGSWCPPLVRRGGLRHGGGLGVLGKMLGEGENAAAADVAEVRPPRAVGAPAAVCRADAHGGVDEAAVLEEGAAAGRTGAASAAGASSPATAGTAGR